MKKSKKISQQMIKATLFDLGKVILDFNFENAFERVSKASPFTPTEVEEYFVRSGLEVLYDGGQISSFQFYRQVKKDLKHSLSYEGFKKIWNEIFTPNKKVISLIQSLSRNHRLVLISNTNQMHFEYIRKKYPVLNYFDTLILSYKVKIRKPDHRIYKLAIKACQAKPHEILYIDDRREMTESAQELGIHAFTFKNNANELEKNMKQLGMLN